MNKLFLCLLITTLVITVSGRTAKGQVESNYTVTKIIDVDTPIPGSSPARSLYYPPGFPAPTLSAKGGQIAFFCGIRENKLIESPPNTKISNPYTQVGSGIFLASTAKPGMVTSIAVLGGPAPEGGTYEMFQAPFVVATSKTGWVSFLSTVKPATIPSPAEVPASQFPHLFVYDMAKGVTQQVAPSSTAFPADGMAIGGDGWIDNSGNMCLSGIVTTDTAPTTRYITPGSKEAAGEDQVRSDTDTLLSARSHGFNYAEIGGGGESSCRVIRLHRESSGTTGLYITDQAGKILLVWKPGDTSPERKIIEYLEDARVWINTGCNLIAFQSRGDDQRGNYVYDIRKKRLDAVAAERLPVPDGSGTYFQILDNLGLNRAGTVAYLASVHPYEPPALAGGPDFFIAIFAQTANGNVIQAVRTGDDFDGSTFRQLEISSRCIDDQGGIVFRYRLADDRYGIAYAKPVR